MRRVKISLKTTQLEGKIFTLNERQEEAFNGKRLGTAGKTIVARKI